MLQRVFSRGGFPASIAVKASTYERLTIAELMGRKKTTKKIKGKKKLIRGARTTAEDSANTAFPYQATAALVTSNRAKAQNAVGFRGQLGQTLWISHPPAAASSPTACEAEGGVPTLLVGLSRTPLQAALQTRCGSVVVEEEEEVLAPGAFKTDVLTVNEYREAVTRAVRGAMQANNATTLRLQLPSEEEVTVVGGRNILEDPHPLSQHDLTEKTSCFAVTGAYQYERLKTKTLVKACLDHGGDDAEEDGEHAMSASSPEKAGSRRGGQGKKAKTQTKKKLREILIDSTLTEAVKTGGIIGAAVNDARSLGNLREDEGTPEFYVQWMLDQIQQQQSGKSGIHVRKVLRGKAIEEAGLSLLYNVGRGSAHTPHVMVLEYIGNKKSKESTALIGKGVTFDCGGLNVKPYGSMETMHTDMMGAATVMTALRAAAALQLPVNLVVAVGLVENAIGPHSYHPGCILRSLSGQTVEVRNTDAEGRLVMADLFTYVLQSGEGSGAKKSTKAGSASGGKSGLKLATSPHTVIDVATLTGAIIVALGAHRAGCFTNHCQLSHQLLQAGSRCGEEVWPMPVGIEHVQHIQGKIADLVNTPRGREGGSCTAAAFLSHFVPRGVRWAHLDIAGPSDAGDNGRGPIHPPGATGFGVQLLVDYLRGNVGPNF